MEVLNFSGSELRKTVWASILGIAFLKFAFVVADLLPSLVAWLLK